MEEQWLSFQSVIDPFEQAIGPLRGIDNQHAFTMSIITPPPHLDIRFYNMLCGFMCVRALARSTHKFWIIQALYLMMYCFLNTRTLQHYVNMYIILVAFVRVFVCVFYVFLSEWGLFNFWMSIVHFDKSAQHTHTHKFGSEIDAWACISDWMNENTPPTHPRIANRPSCCCCVIGLTIGHEIERFHWIGGRGNECNSDMRQWQTHPKWMHIRRRVGKVRMRRGRIWEECETWHPPLTSDTVCVYMCVLTIFFAAIAINST